MRRAPLFSALDDEAGRALLSEMGTTRMERGDILFREGDPGDRLYVIECREQGRPAHYVVIHVGQCATTGSGVLSKAT